MRAAAAAGRAAAAAAAGCAAATDAAPPSAPAVRRRSHAARAGPPSTAAWPTPAWSTARRFCWRCRARRWSCRRGGGVAPVDPAAAGWRRVGRPRRARRHAGTLRVGGLQPGARYQFRLIAHNEYGSARPALRASRWRSAAAPPRRSRSAAVRSGRSTRSAAGCATAGRQRPKGSALATAAVVSAAVLLVGCACVCCCCVLLSVSGAGGDAAPLRQAGRREDAWENGAPTARALRASIVLGDGSPPGVEGVARRRRRRAHAAAPAVRHAARHARAVRRAG